MTDVTTTATDIHDKLPDDSETSVDSIEEKLKEYVNDFNVPLEEARQILITNMDQDLEHATSDEVVKIDQLDEGMDDEFFSMEVVVVDIWDVENDAIAMKGLVGDETGTTIFTIFQSSVEQTDGLLLEKDETYHLEGVVGEYFNGDVNIKITATTTVERSTSDVTVPKYDLESTGVITAIYDGSGLIKRCTDADCNRVLRNGQCSEHEDSDGEFDIRIKGAFDDGDQSYQAVLGTETTQAITGFDTDSAIELAESQMDKSAVVDRFEQEVLSRVYDIKANNVGDNLVIEGIQPVEFDTEARVNGTVEEYGGGDR